MTVGKRSKPFTNKTEPKNRRPEISASRKAAFGILLAVERGQSHSDDLLRGGAVNELSAPDRNLATALVLGVLRWQIQLDRQIHALLARPNARLDAEILIALRMGAFQLLHMDRIPARAVLSESVELAKQTGHRFASGLVNAVLRRLASGEEQMRRAEQEMPRAAERVEDSGEIGAEQHSGAEAHVDSVDLKRGLKPSPPSDSSLSAAREAHPGWMVERWIKSFGLEMAEGICLHGQSQPVVAVRLASPEVEDELTAAGIHIEPGELLATARIVTAGDVGSTAAFREGRVRLQDEGSQLVAELAGLVGGKSGFVGENSGRKVKTIVDCCAAPGGKTLILAERNPGARIVACDSSAERLRLLRERLAPFGDRVECRLGDAATLAENAAFDLALADVPCSGTGTLGRNPEIRHRLRLEDLTRQAERQRTILAAALRAVRPGGRVVYSTCSLEPEENEQVVAEVLAANPNARQISLEARISEMLAEGVLTEKGAAGLRGSLTAEGCLRLLPGRFRTDGFFICLMATCGGA